MELKTLWLGIVISLAAFAYVLLLVAAALAQAVNGVALLVIDGDSYVAHQAISDLDLPERFSVRAFCLSDLSDEGNARFVETASLIIVDIMDDKLSGYVIEHSLLDGRPVFALRGSKDDRYLVEQGFVFNEARPMPRARSLDRTASISMKWRLPPWSLRDGRDIGSWAPSVLKLSNRCAMRA